MAARARRGEELFHPLDAKMPERQGYVCKRDAVIGQTLAAALGYPQNLEKREVTERSGTHDREMLPVALVEVQLGGEFEILDEKELPPTWRQQWGA